MSAERVDVVQVLDDVIARLLYSDKALASKVNASLIAVSELIAAIGDWGAAREAQIRAVGTDEYGAARNRYEAARDRFDVALARVKGEVA